MTRAENSAAKLHRALLWLAVLIVAIRAIVAGADNPHPLDGLTVAEYEIVSAVLAASGKVTDESHLVLVNLAEPDKQQVLAWKPGDNLPRRALVTIRHQRQLIEALVDIGERTLVSWTAIEGAQPALLGSEWLLSQQLVRADPSWQQAIKRRGIEELKSVFCFPIFPGNFGGPRDQGNQRLGMVSCYQGGGGKGLWGRPIEGLVAVVDYDERKLVELIDTGPVPIPAGGPAVNPDQPDVMPAQGPAQRRFRIQGQWIEWDKWRFHLRIDPRVGPVLSQVSILDGDRRRSVMYQGSISEMFVPYMDPGDTWYYRTYLDVGEYGVGSGGVPLRRGRDCPEDAALVDAAFVDEGGTISTKTGIACIFERTTGDAAWSHYEVRQGASLARRHTELVARFIVWLGNYDYVIDWIFTETGSLKGRVGATGIVQVKGVASKDMAAKSAANDTAYGRLIAPGTVAVNHDHFFGFRLDLDVDGTNNGMLIDRVRKVDLDKSGPDKTGRDSPRKQIWQVFPHKAKVESEAKLNVDPRQPALWRVINPAVSNGVGNPVSYQLRPGMTGMTLLDDAEPAHRRAAFTAYNLWVTPYQPAERYAAGTYPNRHPGGAGLPEWTASDRSITDTDIVLWYTIGLHHVVRAEDWPIMPLVESEFELRPFDFFDANPTATEGLRSTDR
jgi:primary-amine oxidase